ncbi:MAG: hypothetical protein V3T08_09680 [Gemmatimonadota bacterium]
MSIYKLFATDHDLEQNGFSLEYGDAKFIIARAGGANKKFQSCIERKLRPYRSAINSGTMDTKTAEKLLAESYAEAIILAWDGVTDEDGDELEFTKENVVKVLLDLPDLFADIQEQSQKVANYISTEAEEDAKS